jgi:hypothetical protein
LSNLVSELPFLVEWDILGVPAERNVKFYTCCDEPYLDITFNITMRRNTNTYALQVMHTSSCAGFFRQKRSRNY